MPAAPPPLFRRGACASALLLLAAWHIGARAAELQPCRLDGVEHEALCGTLQRPLNPAQPQGTSIAVAYAVLPAVARHKLPDPVYFVAGGPGQSAIDLAGAVSQLLRRVGVRRDIVLVDQRGTGRSAPLVCDDVDRVQPLAQQLDLAQRVRDLQHCRERLARLPHGDLRFYDTETAVTDAEAVRAALGHARINLVGASYGTRFILAYMRRYPGRVRRAVLDGVVPPDMKLPAVAAAGSQQALEAVLSACEGDAACRRDHPQLRQNWRALLAAPAHDAEIAHPLHGGVERVRVDRATVAQLVRSALYVPVLASALPHAIDAAAQGRYAPLVGLAAVLEAPSRAVAAGMHVSVVCSEDLPAPTPAATTAATDAAVPRGDDGLFAAGIASLYTQVCATWPRADVPAAFYTVPPAPSPTLLLSGGADPATPPRHATRVAQALGARARHLIVSQAGHGVMTMPCVRDAVAAFLLAEPDTAALQVDLGCAQGVPRPPAYAAPVAPASR